MIDESNSPEGGPPEGGESKIWIDETGIVNVIASAKFSEHEISQLISGIRRVLKDLKTKAKILVDIGMAVSPTTFQFRRVITDHLKETEFEKMAIFGGTQVSRIVTSFVVVASGVENIKVFDAKEEALKWLK
jgi:hypothetical protein